jgi:hypothetical protein
MSEDPAALGSPPAGVALAVAADLKSDKAGEPRVDVVAVPPPGTYWQGFWGNPATHGAIIVTVGLGLLFARAWITEVPVSREGVAIAVEASVWAWLGAAGIRAIGGKRLGEK